MDIKKAREIAERIFYLENPIKVPVGVSRVPGVVRFRAHRANIVDQYLLKATAIGLHQKINDRGCLRILNARPRWKKGYKADASQHSGLDIGCYGTAW